MILILQQAVFTHLLPTTWVRSRGGSVSRDTQPPPPVGHFPMFPMFPSQLGHMISTVLDTKRLTSRRYPCQMAEPPQLAPFGGAAAPRSVTEAEHRRSSQEVCLCRFCPRAFFCQFPPRVSDHLRCEWERRLTNQSTASPSDSRKQISNVTADAASIRPSISRSTPSRKFLQLDLNSPTCS